MRVFWALGWYVVLVATAWAKPVPPPPEGFGGAQYVDDTGCVFVLQHDTWVRRRDGAGQPVCGFPPSMSSRRQDPDTVSVLTQPEQPEIAGAEELLARKLATGLRQGEFAADQRPAETRREVPPHNMPNPLQGRLGQMAEYQARVQQAVAAAGNSTSGLCAQLGYRPDVSPEPILGADVTQGLCPGMRAPTPEERVLAGQRTRAGMPPSAPAEAAHPVAAQPPMARQQAAAPRPPAMASARRATKRPAAAGAVEMIPASARYVQVGIYAEDQNASGTIRRLSGLGYKTAQSFQRRDNRAVRLILAGPFTDRQALVAALNRLRAHGYPHAIAR
ncbi:SPOR domain-containing protein [Paracoccus sp. (in: a-proteobacteria)]|uniref:SPOR domain-containing protein n=1 Tax=Paracoccus sp. TaxID=267 RepID=UPI003A8A4114